MRVGKYVYCNSCLKPTFIPDDGRGLYPAINPIPICDQCGEQVGWPGQAVVFVYPVDGLEYEGQIDG